MVRGEATVAAIASWIAALNAGSDTVRVFDVTRMYSSKRLALSKPAAARMWSALRAWPVLVSEFSICFVPTCMPTNTAMTTNASQPKIAVLRWPALQRPILAARLLDFLDGDMTLLRGGLRYHPSLPPVLRGG